MTILHIGKQAPRGFYESGRSIHIGKGIWILPVKPIPKGMTKDQAIFERIKNDLR